MEGSQSTHLILVLESTAAHAELITAAFRESAIAHQIVTIADGSQARDFLYRRGEYQTTARPDLILLDLNLEGWSGIEVLQEIKQNPQLKRIPVIILALSERAEDVLSTYTLQGNCYVVKSGDRDRLFQVIRRIEEFWLGIVTLPVE